MAFVQVHFAAWICLDAKEYSIERQREIDLDRFGPLRRLLVDGEGNRATARAERPTVSCSALKQSFSADLFILKIQFKHAACAHRRWLVKENKLLEVKMGVALGVRL